jgi:GNAT superfamily N-acetyltransferase
MDTNIRGFTCRDAQAVRELFISVNRFMCPPGMAPQFESYIERSLLEEIDRIPAYYSERGGGFWVALHNDMIVGMFGLEVLSECSFELRRMYVEQFARGNGIASAMLRFAEKECLRRGRSELTLSTSELQTAALRLYKKAGFELIKDEIAEVASNRTIGGGIRRFHFRKFLDNDSSN